ncbi:hypothetical protein [Oceanobacillus senegalensis]|uniref:hypothetical protein n=1 Tax=Oceanobacillus senegalensis TaxID=1936063 RepID=UPI000A30B912|nr:hypothetical protein [Oceanobacillus senegalensis]
MEYIFIIIAFLLIINVSIRMRDLEGRIKRMQYTVDQLAQQTDLPENPIHDELHELIKEGKDVKAVKKARVAFGFSLLEEYIDKLKSDSK